MAPMGYREELIREILLNPKLYTPQGWRVKTKPKTVRKGRHKRLRPSRSPKFVPLDSP